jgi:von Willebrand factor
VTIKFADGGKVKTIKLNQGMQVLVEDLEITTLPKKMMNGLLKIKKPSESFVVVDFQGGFKIWWDGQTRVYIDAPASFRGKTQGLCGTFNANLQDDFLTPEGDVETAIAPFADKWRTKESCPLMSDSPNTPHPCTLNLAKKEKAIEICNKLTASVFDGKFQNKGNSE